MVVNMDTSRQRTRYDWLLEILSLISLIIVFYPIAFYGELGNDVLIPIHYNALGEIDGWGGKQFLWLLPIISIMFYVGLSLFERINKDFNYPIKVKKENLNELGRLEVRMLKHLKFIVILLFSYMNNASFAVAINKGSGLNKFIMILLMSGLFLTILYFFINMISLKE